MQNRELYSLSLCSYCCGLKGTGTQQEHRQCFQDDVKISGDSEGRVQFWIHGKHYNEEKYELCSYFE